MPTRLTFGSFTFRITPFRLLLLALTGLCAGVSLYRLAAGLGAATNLSDRWPWGLWILIDVKLGVALAAGGFTTCGLYYVLGLKQFKPIVKPALLTAWLGYSMVGIGLLLDLGLWYNFWHPLVYWGHSSVMFELFWCVLLYTIVLTLEFSPTVFARLGLAKLQNLVLALTLPLVIIGIVLSTLHQSSLGSLYIIMLGKLDPLWWSMLLPLFYFLTAVAVGPAMVTVEAFFSARAYRREFELDLMRALGRYTAGVLAVYLALKVIDLAYRGQLGAAFAGTLAGNMFLLELLAGVVAPIAIYALPALRQRRDAVVGAAGLVVAGVVLNRFNVVFSGMRQAAGGGYFPSWMEIAITLGLVSAAILAFAFFVENFAVFPAGHEEAAVAPAGRQGERAAQGSRGPAAAPSRS